MFLEIFGLGLVFPFIISLLDPEKLSGIEFLNELISYLGIPKTYNFTKVFDFIGFFFTSLKPYL